MVGGFSIWNPPQLHSGSPLPGYDILNVEGLKMADATADQARRYIADGSNQDLRRLLSISESVAENGRRALRRVGIADGWTVIDCGCGPLGGLAVLAEMVGPGGRVVGVDFSEPSIQRARSVVATLGLGNVDLVVGDINELDGATLGGPFDLAFTRLFLMDQPDVVRTLGQIARLLRPGGWIVAHEALRNPPPRSHPHLDGLATYWGLLHEVMGRTGLPRGTVEGLPGSARAAGLEVARVEGFFSTLDPELGFELHASTLAAARERAVKTGIAAKTIDGVIARLRSAKAGGYEWVTSPFFLDLALRKPEAV
jgi:ubiquinone/menaquinone biosynthesis C-methylase UbiE